MPSISTIMGFVDKKNQVLISKGYFNSKEERFNRYYREYTAIGSNTSYSSVEYIDANFLLHIGVERDVFS